MLRKLFFCQQWMLMLFLVLAVLKFADPAYAATGEEQLFTNVPPNVLFILDNSNSMDEDNKGNAVTSFNTDSKSVIGRKALQNIVNSYADKMRIGLMTYRLPSAQKYHLHNAAYFSSYDPKSYCPSTDDTVLAACQAYCINNLDTTSRDICQGTAGVSGCRALNSVFDATYFDEIIAYGTTAQKQKYCGLVYPKTIGVTNITDVSHYIYYKQALPYYDAADQGTEFDYATAYPLVTPMPESPGVNQAVPGVSYARWRNKIGTSDGNEGYSNSAGGNVNFGPTDSDVALGYLNFGRRLFSYHVGRTWFANSSPGGGFLHVAAADNDLADTQKNKLLAKLATNESDETGYMACTDTGNPNNCAYVVNAGLTPMAGSFRSAYNYFKGEADYQSGVSYTSPIQDYCQKNFVVYVTDGLPSVNETGAGGTAADLSPGVLTRIENLHAVTKTIGSVTTFDVETYVIGVALTDTAQTYLDAMAVQGHTAVGNKALYANSLTDLNAALNNVFLSITGKAFSFSTASVSASRVKDEGYIYEASFLPSPLSTKEPFWLGFLRQYKINPNGTIDNAYLWDAGQVLKGRPAADRSIRTWKSGVATVFKTPTDGGSITAADLNVATDTERDTIVSFIRGGELDSAYTYFGWKLGDIFHSSPKTIGTPSNDYTDQVDTQLPRAYKTFRDANPRTTTAGPGQGKRIIVVGANDGQMHAFRTTDGAEQWSFIPPNLLPNLKNIVHTTHSPIPGGLNHTYFVDGHISASDVWLPDTPGDGTTKDSADWYTYMVFGLRQGGSNTLWSSVAGACSSDFSATYSSGYPNYCGYYALDITDTLSPVFKWRIGGASGLTSTDGPYFGQPWSKMAIGRIKYNGNETWVGFVGGGYSGVNCAAASCTDTRGKGFYVVNMSKGHEGEILWRFTRSDSPDYMNYDLAGIPAIVDVDNDGFIDTVYMGDTGGNMWRFKFCLQSEGACTWSGDRLFATDAVHPIYTSPSVAKDSTGNTWVYFGTGNILDPSNTTVTERFYALKDNDRSTTYSISNLKDITSYTYCIAIGAGCTAIDTQKGWYINLAVGEKALADPTVFRGVLYFTTYLPSTTSSLCDKSGSSNLYAMDFVTGAGLFTSNVRFTNIGQGLGTNVIVSLNPEGGTDVYGSISVVKEGESHTKKLPTPPIADLNRTNLLFWRDMRVD